MNVFEVSLFTPLTLGDHYPRPLLPITFTVMCKEADYRAYDRCVPTCSVR